MRLKSTLWALAFACAAVSCSDDLEDGPNVNGNGDKWTGETAKVKVSINTGMATKALTGEEGDITNGEAGTREESEVKDITIFLFAEATAADGLTADTDYDSDPATILFSKHATLVAAGYSAVDNTTESTRPNDHSWEAEVGVAVKPDANLAGNSYGVLAITNLNNEKLVNLFMTSNSPLKKVSDLADYLEESIHTENGFIMSTHMVGEHPGEDGNNKVGPYTSRISFPQTADPNDVPATEVFVERLAAKVRVSEHPSGGDSNAEAGYIYALKDDKGDVTGDKVRLDQAAVINQLVSGSYLLKRTTPDTDGEWKTNAELGDVEDDVLLGDEKIAPDGKGLYGNFVIDPWTRAKSIDDAKIDATTNIPIWASITGKVTLPTDKVNKALAYENYIARPDDNNNNHYDYSEIDKYITGKKSSDFTTNQYTYKTLAGNDANQIHLAYIRENTTSKELSKNGYSTGVLFKATYFVKKVMALPETAAAQDGRSIVIEELLDDDYKIEEIEEGNIPTFYTYKHLKFKDYESIFAYSLLMEIPENQFEEATDGSLTLKKDASIDDIYLYESFKDNTGLSAISLADYLDSRAYKLQDGDPFGYLAYVKNIVDEKKNDIDSNTGLTDEEKLDAYTNTTLYSTNVANNMGVKTFNTYLEDTNLLPETSSNQSDMTWAKVHENVKEYEHGLCFYPYWIHHEDNGIPTGPGAMGVMEFAIVRNNIYDLAVKSINNLGLSSVDVPDPKKDDEETNTLINVTVKVRNWVVRNNGSIVF